MLFEPSGVLRCDYGAYCHALDITEREEVHRSLVTNEELRREEEAKYLEVCAATQRHLCAEAGAGSSAEPEPPAAPPAAAAAGSTSKRGGSNASTQKKKKKVPAEDPAKVPVPAIPPPITFIKMRHLNFCLNMRDMKPLALAMPHCLSLVSVEFVGCGLSRESYYLLVEGIYKSRRVSSVTIDFNRAIHPGFYEDPTIDRRVASLDHVQRLEIPLFTVERVLSPNEAASSEDDNCCAWLKDAGPSPLKEDLPHELKQAQDKKNTFAPSAYRGFNHELSPLELQLREERERKGKMDSKKQTQLQQQRDQIAQLDKDYPISVPQGWSSVLLTGVKHLSLRGNGICDNDVALMASLLLRHPRSELVSLNLWGNCITNVGVMNLARMLKKNRTLQVLDLGHNSIGDAGLLELVDCFRMQEIPVEELQAYRRRHLARRDATSRERQLAALPPPPYPSYQELYATWYQSKFHSSGDEKKDLRKVSQGKGRKAEPVLIRPSNPFDCDCFRMEGAVRVPGNTVLRCINLGNNKEITLVGARAALRVLSLREPSDDDMPTLQNSATKPPELYCVSIALRTFIILHDDDPEMRVVQRELSEMLHTRQLQQPLSSMELEGLAEEAKRKSPRPRK